MEGVVRSKAAFGYRKRSFGDAARSVFDTTLAAPEGVELATVYKRIEQRISTDGFTFQPSGVMGIHYAETLARISIGLFVRAGWVASQGTQLVVTAAGRDAYSESRDIQEMLDCASRKSLKSRVSFLFPGFYVFLSRLKYQLGVEYGFTRRLGLRGVVRSFLNRHAISATGKRDDFVQMQSPRTMELAAPCGGHLNSLEACLKSLDEAGLGFDEDGESVYIPPRSASGSVFGSIVRDYPGDAGLLIRKDVHKGQGSAGSQARSLLVANMLFANGVGPRLYDEIALGCGGDSLAVYVIQHVEGKEPSPSQIEAAIDKLKDLEQQGWIAIAPGNQIFQERSADTGATTKRSSAANSVVAGPTLAGSVLANTAVTTPAAGGSAPANAIVAEDGRFLWTRFWDFAVKDYPKLLKRIADRAIESSHWGDKSVLRGWRYLYQSIPGVALPSRRNTTERIKTIEALMEQAGVSVKDRLVLDIGCNMGMMISQYLHLGAKWCHGWDRAQIAGHTEEMLLALGCTRFSITGSDLENSRALGRDLAEFLKPDLNGCVISYLAVRQPLGWLDALGQIPWSFLIYEGHEDDTDQDLELYLGQLGKLAVFSVAAKGSYKDGDSAPRTIAVLVREGVS
ncbi:MAG TPA: hypothetical protein VJX67_25765 [Blastocatellia bacterium]|nr:hypothetical protein [Blastocatellia bacterium]